MNPFVYIQILVEALEDYRWIVEAATACYPIVMMSRIHTAQPNPIHITTGYKMVSEHLLPRPVQKQQFLIGYEIYRAKQELSPISSISITLSTSSPDLKSNTTITSSKNSSTGSDASDVSNTAEISSFSTDNTLSMITTPWTTESWSGGNIVETFETYSVTVMNPVENLTSVTIDPASTTSLGGLTLELNSVNINTITLLDINETKSSVSVNFLSVPSSHKLKGKTKSYSESTFESWTVESFTSFVEYSDSNVVKVQYPWSPCTYLSGTDIYPDSMDTLSSEGSLINSLTLDSMTRSVDITSSPKVL